MGTEIFTFVKVYKQTHGCSADVTKVVSRDEAKCSSVLEELCKLTKVLYRALVRVLYPKETYKKFLKTSQLKTLLINWGHML